MIKIMQYTSEYVHSQRPKLVQYLKDNLNNIAEGYIDVGSGMLLDLKNERKAILFIAWRQGVPIAWTSLTFRPWDSLVQVGVYVHPKHRRKGIGTRLLAKARAWTKRKGRSLCCHPWNEAGDLFYSKADISYQPAWSLFEESIIHMS